MDYITYEKYKVIYQLQISVIVKEFIFYQCFYLYLVFMDKVTYEK